MMKIRSDIYFVAAKIYSRLYGFFKDYFDIHIRGLGYILRKVRSDHVLLVCGRYLHFAHEMAEAYTRPLHGKWNEPETHILFEHVLSQLSIVFIDVGANIGEILVDIASHPNCVNAIAFEPNPSAVNVINKNLRLNSLNNCTIKKMALGHVKAQQKMIFGSHSPTASLFLNESFKNSGVDVEISTLDSEINFSKIQHHNVVILIDVEGYELNVIRGGRRLISAFLPLIIFEYHQETRKVFGLSELQIELGDLYQVFRVRKDAMLDDEVNNAWNCVAVPRNTIFESILASRIVS